uniref:Uncharacterized protein n=1 Tax=Lepeophtheirus salmonis TaxID=72036 RepID=A0A0K2UKL8_LEPSM
MCKKYLINEVLIYLMLIFHHAISYNFVGGENVQATEETTLPFYPKPNHPDLLPSFSSILHSVYDESTHETGSFEFDAQKKSSESKSMGRKDLISGELLVSIPLKVILSSLKDNPFLLGRDFKQGSPKPSSTPPLFSISSHPLPQTSSIDDILSYIGLGPLSHPCKLEFICSILSRPIKYRPLSDILYLLLTSPQEKDEPYKQILLNKSHTCAPIPTGFSNCHEPQRINLGILRLWQRLSKYYDFHLSP